MQPNTDMGMSILCLWSMLDICSNSCTGNLPAHDKPTPFRPDDTIWQEYVNAATDEDKKMIKSWGESMDVLLVFVRLLQSMA